MVTKGIPLDMKIKQRTLPAIALILISYTAPFMAASETKWVVLDAGVNTKTAIDENSIVLKGDHRRARNATFNEDGSVVLVYQNYDCELRRVRLDQFFERASNGKTIEIPLGESSEQWLSIPANSTLERLFDFVCSRRL